MRRIRVAADREMKCFEAKILEAAADIGPLRDLRSKSPPKCVLMTSSSDLP
jgi:hypothetical protein